MQAGNTTIIAIVGMPGSGKSQVTSHLEEKGFSFVRFGQQTDDALKEQGLQITPENEQAYREAIRSELGMAAYAIVAKPKIDALLLERKMVALDGLYSWEEYTFLKEAYPGLVVLHVYAQPAIRYQRLGKRTVRPLTKEDAVKRDFMEIERLNKGGPIAIADFVIDNSSIDLSSLHKKIDKILEDIEKRKYDSY